MVTSVISPAADQFTELRETARTPAPDISVVVVNYNTGYLLQRMFSALDAARAGLTIEVIVIDNASTDSSADLIERDYPAVILIKNSRNVGFGRANNQALPHIRGRYVLLLNTDAFVEPDTLQKTVEYLDRHSNCGVLGVRLVGEDGSLQPSCRSFPTPWNVFLQRTGLYRLFRGYRWSTTWIGITPRFVPATGFRAATIWCGERLSGSSGCLTRVFSFTTRRWIIVACSARRAGRWFTIRTQRWCISAEKVQKTAARSLNSGGRFRRCRLKASCSIFANITG